MSIAGIKNYFKAHSTRVVSATVAKDRPGRHAFSKVKAP